MNAHPLLLQVPATPCQDPEKPNLDISDGRTKRVMALPPLQVAPTKPAGAAHNASAAAVNHPPPCTTLPRAIAKVSLESAWDEKTLAHIAAMLLEDESSVLNFFPGIYDDAALDEAPNKNLALQASLERVFTSTTINYHLTTIMSGDSPVGFLVHSYTTKAPKPDALPVTFANMLCSFVAKEHRRQNIATYAKQLLYDTIFAKDDISYIESFNDPNNAASLQVSKKLGAQIDGGLEDGGYYMHVTRDGWKQRTSQL